MFLTRILKNLYVANWEMFSSFFGFDKKIVFES